MDDAGPVGPGGAAVGAVAGGAARREWRWAVSAALYRYSYLEIAHRVDDDLFAYLGADLTGAVAVDCGCGPGVVVAKLLDHGAGRVFAVDANASMLRQVRDRLPDAVEDGRVVLVNRVVDTRLFPELSVTHAGGRGYDLVLFKRSLYGRPEATLATLRAAVAGLAPGGAVAIVHPAAAVRHYAFGAGWQPARHTAYHLFNRLASRIGVWLGAGEYNVYDEAELVALARAAAGDRPVELLPTAQRAFVMVAVRGGSAASSGHGRAASRG